MNFYIIPAALVITLIVTFILSVVSNRPMRGLWIVFLLIFLATWTGQLWIIPVGPRVSGVAWVPLLVMGLIFLFFLLALVPAASKNKKEGEVAEGPLMALGIFFWIIIVLLILPIAGGYYMPHPQV